MRVFLVLSCAILFSTSALAKDGKGKMLSFGMDSGLASSGLASVQTRAGIEMNPGLFLSTGIDLQRITVAAQDRNNSENVSLSLLTLEAGTKYYQKGRERGEVSTYVLAAAVMFVPMGSGSDDIERDINQMKNDVSLYGFKTGFGAEYFLTSRFAIGGETGANVMIANFRDGDFTMSASVLDIYTGFRLVFFL